MFLFLLTIFVLSLFIGWEIITKVPPTLHTPLMSGSNAISGITIIGALTVTVSIGDPEIASAGWQWLIGSIAFLAIVLATINVVGGFLVTNRMLGMFRKKGERS